GAPGAPTRQWRCGPRIPSHRRNDMTIDAFEIESPLGRLLLYARGGRLLALGFDNERSAMERLVARRRGSAPLRRVSAPADLRRRFRDYFAGALDALEGIEVDTAGTPFQRRVW